jgi:ankyrin repeat protein
MRCLKVLLYCGFSPSIVFEEGRTSLLNEICIERIYSCRTLLEIGTDPYLALDTPTTPLHVVIWRRRQDIMELLLEHKANINKRELENGWLRTSLQLDVQRKGEKKIE